MTDPVGKSSISASRREFLASAAAVAGAGALNLGAIGGTAHAAGSDIIKVGLVGCGGRGSGAAERTLSGSSSHDPPRTT